MMNVDRYRRVLSSLAVTVALMMPMAESRANDVEEEVTVSTSGPAVGVGFNEGSGYGLDWTSEEATKRLKITLKAPGTKQIKAAHMVFAEGVPWECSDADQWASEHLYVTDFFTADRTHSVLFFGQIRGGGGGGGQGTPPTWEVGVILADIQADADNDSTTAQRPPATAEAERKEEEVAEQASGGNTTGLIVPVNRDYHEGDTNEDYAHTGIVTSDPDLVQIKLVLELPTQLRPGSTVKLTYDTDVLKVYKSTTLVPSGTSYDVNTFGVSNILYLEGLLASSSVGANSVRVTLTSPNEKVSKDKVVATLVKIDLKPYKTGEEGETLSEKEEENPGLYTRVNWGDEDGDGWTQGGAPPNASYTPDKDDTFIFPCDGTLQELDLSILPNGLPGKVKVTFPTKVKLYTTLTKKKLIDGQWVSAVVNSGDEVNANTLAALPWRFLEGQSGSASFQDVEVKIQYRLNNKDVKGETDRVKVTVFEVIPLTGNFGFGPQSTENNKKHSMFNASNDKCGKISWDDANGDGTKNDNDPFCQYFCNCMECRGTVKPTGVVAEVEFHWLRDLYRKIWKKKVGGAWAIESDKTPWEPDDHANHTDEDNTPSTTAGKKDYIFQLDAPRLLFKTTTASWDYLAYIGDFRDRVEVKIYGQWYQCSDFYKWHAQLYTMPKPNDAPNMTRTALDEQKLGQGWITIPANPP